MSDKKWFCAQEYADINYTSIEELEEIIDRAIEDKMNGLWRGLCVEHIETNEPNEHGGTYLHHRVIITGERLETDEEYNTRLKQDLK